MTLQLTIETSRTDLPADRNDQWSAICLARQDKWPVTGSAHLDKWPVTQG